MQPDKQHEEYYKNNPNGNHRTAPETRVALKFIQKEMAELKNAVNTFERKDMADEKHDQIIVRLDNIYKEQQKTNGRVGALETWRTAIVAGGGVLLFMTTFFGDKIRNLF